MKKMTLRIILFVAGLSGLASCCNAQASGKTQTTANKAKTCSNCGKTSCAKSCSLNSSTEKKDTVMQTKTLPSCSLSEKEFAQRGDTLSKTIFSKAKSITPLKDGYDIIFQEPKEFSSDLLEMVNFERNCCSGFTWALIFDPNNTATHLQVYG